MVLPAPSTARVPVLPPLGKEKARPPVQSNQTFPEAKFLLPGKPDPAVSWLFYDCWIEDELDSGMALHKPLPQQAAGVDTLALIAMDDPNREKNVPTLGGVNLNSLAPTTDIIQRMATSTYRFILRGEAYRAGYQIPIPKVVKIGTRTPTPTIQRAFNRIVGNASGIPVWYAAWELHYIVTGMDAAQVQTPVPPNLALHIRSDQQLPDVTQPPWSWPDQSHLSNAPEDLDNVDLGNITTQP